ncbi:TFIIE alpha subunit-domain-containing protein [Lipomyces tetrasporus]|uniref:TFIIE alpha subunit-domain-containing protein n=1 Tax=Lipomyces tetrasporus TaxID=54092 RepID=A0AAD7VT12_9ASCO|nr:TFIIE alpha subunit-domain-containing protein [Lipomyces tetrasporus]KAJ8100526.1 TFIIE alpha subunit-domain-containing protein [Lipomyces tetrasporus]
MEHVKVLIQFVARSFYETRYIVILDAVLRHNVVSDDDLPQMVGIQKKELHKLCAKLRDDRLLKIHTRSEPKEGQQRPVHRTYYYIHYREAVDAIKWRIHKLGETFNDKMRNDVDRQGYACPLCKRRYSAIDVLPLQAPDLSGFVCEDCGSILQDDDDSDELRISQERLARLMSQIRRIIDTLKKIDDTFIPDNDFDMSLKVAMPTSIEVGDTPDKIGYAARGTNNTTLSIEVDLSGDKVNDIVTQTKLEKAQQNALPVWYQKSTIGIEKSVKEEPTDEATVPNTRENEPVLKREGTVKEEPIPRIVETSNGDAGMNEAAPEDVIAAYYKSLQSGEDEDEDDDDDDEEEEEEDDEFGEMETL